MVKTSITYLFSVFSHPWSCSGCLIYFIFKFIVIGQILFLALVGGLWTTNNIKLWGFFFLWVSRGPEMPSFFSRCRQTSRGPIVGSHPTTRNYTLPLTCSPKLSILQEIYILPYLWVFWWCTLFQILWQQHGHSLQARALPQISFVQWFMHQHQSGTPYTFGGTSLWKLA